MPPKGRGGRGKQIHRQNKPAVPNPNTAASGSKAAVPDLNPDASGSNPAVSDPNPAASGDTQPGSSLRIPIPETPNPDALREAAFGFGYNPDTKGYEIVRIVRYRDLKQPDVAYLFNFQSGRWDNLGVVNFRTAKMKCDAVVDGVPYLKAWMKEEGLGNDVLKLVWFDVRTLKPLRSKIQG